MPVANWWSRMAKGDYRSSLVAQPRNSTTLGCFAQAMTKEIG